ncbi:O-antigen ligase family protein [Synechococcus sp. AH-707-B22]|nr:O-antigen ligase family protein [Synechococcus sp. AH-707-B22]
MKYCFGIWLFFLLLARIPLAAIQHSLGWESRPYVIINVLGLILSAFSFYGYGFMPLRRLCASSAKPFLIIFVSFWLLYFMRAAIDQYVFHIVMVRDLSMLFKMFVNTTLIPFVCLIWIQPEKVSVQQLKIPLAMGSIGVVFAAVVFAFRNTQGRFSFADLNPIPASYSALTLMILAALFLLKEFSNCRQSKQIDKNKYLLNIFLPMIGLVSGSFVLVESSTKSSFLALLVQIIVLACLFSRFSWGRFVLIGIASSSAVLAIVFSRVDRFSSVFNYESLQASSTFAVRIKALKYVWTWIGENPWLGKGFEYSYQLRNLPDQSISYPHNLFSEAFVIGGLPLGILFIAYVLISLRATCIVALNSYSPKDFNIWGAWLVLLWVQGMVWAQFSGQLALLPLFWLSSWLVVLYASRLDFVRGV